MKKIILDTNFLLIPGELKVDIFSEIDRIMDESYQLYILDKTIDELNNIIQNQKSKHRLAANIAKELIKDYKIKIIKTETDDYVDNQLLKQKDAIIATQDKDLKTKLKTQKTPVIELRQKKYLKRA